MPLFLREAEVRSLLSMDQTLAALEAAFHDYSAGHATNQPRRRVTAGATLATMSAALPAAGLVGFKAYTTARAGVRFWVCLFDAVDGRPRAVIEADWLGRMRTGAASGIATRYLARAEAAIMTVIGTGSQALTQVLGVAGVRPLQEVRVFSPNGVHRTAFVARLSTVLAGVAIKAMASVEAALDGADIITTITSAGRPIVFGSRLTAGQHLNVCGSNIPDHREVDKQAVTRADLLVADDVDAARLEAGDFLMAEREGALDWSRVHGLRELVAGTVARRRPADLTLFKSVGLAIEDVAAAAQVLSEAERRGVGQHLPE